MFKRFVESVYTASVVNYTCIKILFVNLNLMAYHVPIEMFLIRFLVKVLKVFKHPFMTVKSKL